jgi:preprotein translocase subunit SecF
MKKAIKTEATMALAALVTFSLMYAFSSVEIIQHIALVLLIGIIFDLINTWGENASLQRLFMERKQE